MRKKMEELASGKFDYREPELSLSEERIELEVSEGKDQTGEFWMNSANHVKMRGIIYSSHPRMECLTPQFDGEEIKVRYQFHSEGLAEGDVIKGEFTIVCNHGEYGLSFAVSVSKMYAETSIGKIKNLSDFTRLARESFEEAYRIFYSKNFTNIIKADEQRERLLYEGIRKEPPSGQKIECFLAASGRKKPVHVMLEQESAEYYEVTGARKEQLFLRKDLWGYITCNIRTDAAFIEIEKTKITTEDFLGSTCFLDFYIREEKLHAGKNFGRIYLDFPEESLVFSVCASRGRKNEEKKLSVHHEMGLGRTRLLQLYMDYRLKKIVTGVWAKNSIAILDRLLTFEPQADFYRLMKAQALLLNRQKQEASWILEDYKRSCTDRETPEWGYYLYLCTLMEREESYVDRLTAEIEALFHKHPDSSLLFWILLFTRDEYYRNSQKRWKAIERWIDRGCHSPYIYLEAYYLIWQDPYLLNRLGSFEIKILNWAGKQDAISRDIALQVMNIVPEQREFNRQIYKILCACYEVLPSDEMLSCICAYLIKGQKLSNAYHNWYALGIEHELRITNLYEAYLVSMDPNEISAVPKMIQMYFRYHNSLSYRQLAVLFVNIIAAKEKQEDVYLKYRRTIEQFAMEQIEAGHIDENLAVIYNEMLKVGILNEELSYKLSYILFTHKLVCKNPRIVKAVIVQKEWKKQQVVPVSDRTAYFQAYTENYAVILMDSEGNCFADTTAYYEEALLNAKEYLGYAMQLAPEAPSYLVSYFSKRNQYERFREKDEVSFEALLRTEEADSAFQAALRTEIIRYYAHGEHGGKPEHYLQDISLEELTVENRRYLIEQMTEAHLFDAAYEAIHLYGYDTIGSAYRVSLCSYEITACEFEEDDFLLGLSDAVFRDGTYNDVILIYLCRFYNGSTKHMAEIWKAAEKFELDTYELEERIITQMLYSTDYVEYMEQIYESYCRGGGRELVCTAYISYFSEQYLVHEAVVPKHVFTQAEERFLRGQKLNEACGIGLLKYYADRETLSERQKELAGRLLDEYICRNMYFSFYKKIDPALTARYQLNDRFFVEYRTQPKTSVIISYSLNGETFVEEEMTEVYSGIFVKQFLLFFGDEVQYYISERRSDGELDATISGQLLNNDVYGEHDHSRFALLNDMLFFAAMQEKKPLKKCMKEYFVMQLAAEELFRLL